jgi:hypothetical protein
MIANSQPAHSLYGTPATQYARPAGDTGTARIAAGSAPYLGRGPKCAGNDDTCNANKVRGQDFCAGHLKTVKVEAEQVVEDD